jgi:hypothetical protein
MPLLSHYNGLLRRAPNFPYYSPLWRRLLSHYNDPLYRAPHCLTLALLGGIYLANIIYRNGGDQTALTTTLLEGLYLDIIM